MNVLGLSVVRHVRPFVEGEGDVALELLWVDVYANTLLILRHQLLILILPIRHMIQPWSLQGLAAR